MPDQAGAQGGGDEKRKRLLSRHIKGAKRYQKEGYDVQEYIWDNEVPDDLAQEIQAAVPPEKDDLEERRQGAAKRMFPGFE